MGTTIPVSNIMAKVPGPERVTARRHHCYTSNEGMISSIILLIHGPGGQRNVLDQLSGWVGEDDSTTAKGGASLYVTLDMTKHT